MGDPRPNHRKPARPYITKPRRGSISYRMNANNYTSALRKNSTLALNFPPRNIDSLNSKITIESTHNFG